ncbi:MAG: hypothetical protein ACP5IZ_10650 [Thermoprotei archaeon]|jgi:uncharacterized protein YjfI (DUF2170 family)
MRGISTAVATLILITIVLILYTIIIPVIPKTLPNQNMNIKTPELKLSLIKAYEYDNTGYIILYNYGDEPINIIKIIHGQTMLAKTYTINPNTITEIRINNIQTTTVYLITDNGITIKIDLEQY